MGGKQCIKVWTITYKEISLKKTKKQDRTIKESELKTNRHNRPIQKSELDINRLYRPIQSEDRIGIGISINRTFRPPLVVYYSPTNHSVIGWSIYELLS